MNTRLCLLLSLTMIGSSHVVAAQDADSARSDETRAPAAAPEAVRHLVEQYGRAIETRDVGLFRSVMPGIGADEEARLKESFAGVRSDVVGITIRSVSMDEASATVQVLREDTVDGQRMKPVRQNLHLIRHDDRWQIRSLSVDH